MYKWHIHSAIGRGRPVTDDFARVAAGIAASLRAFSVSVARANGDDEAPRSRSERSAAAVEEISSVAPSRGIDARSLAARPPGALNISRYMVGGASSETPRPNFAIRRAVGRADATRGTGRAPIRRRRDDDDEEDMEVTSELMPSRGRGGRGRGRRRGRGGGMRVGTMSIEDEERERELEKEEAEEAEEDPPYTVEELQEMDRAEGGYENPYEPNVTEESLRGGGPAVLTSTRGLLETITYKMQAATGNINGFHEHGGTHLDKMNLGNGTIFESQAAKDATQDYVDRHRKERLEKAKWHKEYRESLDLDDDDDYDEFEEGQEPKPKPKKEDVPLPETYESIPIPTLAPAERTKLAQVWAAGHYEIPKPVLPKGNVLEFANTQMLRNETFLAGDRKKFLATLQSLLPAEAQRQQSARKS